MPIIGVNCGGYGNRQSDLETRDQFSEGIDIPHRTVILSLLAR